MRTSLEHWQRTGCKPNDRSRIIQEQIELCEFDEGFLLGFELGSRSKTSQTKLQGDLMADYPLTTGDSVVITLTDTDTVTNQPVAIDAGSVTFELSDTADAAVLNADGTITLTAGATIAAGKTITVNATVGGIASAPWVGAYDVVAVADPTALSGVFGTETPATSDILS
jgi:hypothetical protein